jgi:hypothetical protein
MAKNNRPDPVGKCEICTINLYAHSGNIPEIWPCNIKGCPYEKATSQDSHLQIAHGSATGTGLGQIDF